MIENQQFAEIFTNNGVSSCFSLGKGNNFCIYIYSISVYKILIMTIYEFITFFIMSFLYSQISITNTCQRKNHISGRVHKQLHTSVKRKNCLSLRVFASTYWRATFVNCCQSVFHRIQT